ncbi:MAG: leucine-rich repeat protein, partial [Ruminococcus sp.]|nr:leucine-rich repeat protein [Ruminococcus sp.]
NNAFLGCTKLVDIHFPSSLKKIGDSAFKGCEALTHLFINEGCEHIGKSAFCNCSNLCAFVMSSTVNKIDESYSYHNEDIFTIEGYYIPYDRRMKGWATYSKNDKVIIYCYAGSYGIEYARKHGYPVRDARQYSK